MCGIAGLMLRAPGNGPAGEIMMRMLRCLQRRGPDSAGVAVYRDEAADGLYTYSVICELPEAERAAAITALVGSLKGAVVRRVESRGIYSFCTIAAGDAPLDLVPKIESHPGFAVAGVGDHMFLVKDVGSVAGLDDRYGITAMTGRWAVGHTRLATESQVDPMHGHPLWARYVPDVCIAHNGHVTNDIRLRASLQTRGYQFKTHNDSEVIAVYLADKLRHGKTLRQALEDSARELDGAFTYIVATSQGIGVVRDPLGFKPIVVGETDELIAFATEYPAVHGVVGGNVPMWEVGAGEVHVWS